MNGANPAGNSRHTNQRTVTISGAAARRWHRRAISDRAQRDITGRLDRTVMQDTERTVALMKCPTGAG